MGKSTVQGEALVGGQGSGAVLFSDVPLSLWGGVDPARGVVIDRHHPLCGQSLAGKVLMLPSGRGSCTGSAVMLQLLAGGKGPAAVIICEREEIITLGVVIAQKFFGKSIPVLRVPPNEFAAMAHWERAFVSNDAVSQNEQHSLEAVPSRGAELDLSTEDIRMLSGAAGEAARLAMEVIVTMAQVYGARRLIDITQAHIDGCIYTGEAGLAFAEHLAELGARVKVPTTLNAISVDRRMWRSLGVVPEFGEPSERLADAYLAMGAKPSYTCAPYLLAGKPEVGEQVAWSESNAVIYANSVLGARTQKYPDYLDICMAITGRAPLSGPHLDEGRKPEIKIVVEALSDPEDALYPLLGYHIGQVCGSHIPLITGLEHLPFSTDDLKAFSAALGTTSGAPMFYIAGVTPAAPAMGDAVPHRRVTKEALRQTWSSLNSADEARIDLVALGNPHFSHSEFQDLVGRCAGQRRHPAVQMIVTCGRDIHAEITADGTLAQLEKFGARVLTDICWCMIEKPVIPEDCKAIATNSGKYVHYGPGLAGISVRLGGLGACVAAVVTGQWPAQPAPFS